MALTENTRGALLMMASMAAFTINDSCMKTLSGEMPLLQAMFIRGLMTCFLLGAWSVWRGSLSLKLPPAVWARVALRSAFEVGSAYFLVTAIFAAPLANVNAVMQALPLTITLAAALFLGEAVGWRRLAAIGVGFVGVLIILRPGPAGFDASAINALLAMLCVTFRDLITRTLPARVPSATVALTGSAAVVLFSALGSVGEVWVQPSPYELATLVLAAVFILTGYILTIIVMRVGDVGAIAPFRYFSLLVAIVLGVVVFGEFPDALTLVGASLVVGSGLFTLYRERRVAQRIATAKKLG